jgi:hypothetical protein
MVNLWSYDITVGYDNMKIWVTMKVTNMIHSSGSKWMRLGGIPSVPAALLFFRFLMDASTVYVVIACGSV